MPTETRCKTTPCEACSTEMCGRQVVMSRVLGGPSTRRCLRCLSRSLDTPPEQLAERVGSYLIRRPCFRRDWRRAETCGQDTFSPCCPGQLEHAANPPAWFQPELFRKTDTDDLPAPDLRIDLEEAETDDVMLLLGRAMRRLEVEQVVELVAPDPEAAADIQQWCQLTGNPLLAGPVGEESASYYILKRA